MRPNKPIVMLSAAILGVALLTGGVFAVYDIDDKAEAKSAVIHIDELVPSYTLKVGTQEYSLTQSGNDYVYTPSLLLEAGSVTVSDGTNDLATFNVPVEGHYSTFTFDGASSLTATQIDKAVYLKQLNDSRLWDAYYCHAWNETSGTTYPGLKMELDSDKGVYKTFIDAAYDKLMFCYNSVTGDAYPYSVKESDNHIKTGDLDYNLATPLYQMSNNVSGVWTALGDTSKSFSGSFDYYLAGSFNSWNSSNPAYGFEKVVSSPDNSKGRYLCKVNIPENGEFKIVSSGKTWYGYNTGDWATGGGSEGNISISAGTHYIAIVDRGSGVNYYVSNA